MALLACHLETEGTGGLPRDGAPGPGAGDGDSADTPVVEDDAFADAADAADAADSPAAPPLDVGDGGAGSSAIPTGPGAAPPSAPAGPARDCKLAGTFALRLDFDVDWQGTSIIGIVPVLAAGSGTLTTFQSVTFGRDGFRAPAEVAPCGAAIPDFEAGQNLFVGERYGAYIPEASWDADAMASWPLSWQAACDEPGCAVTSNLLEALLGTRTRDPAGRPGPPGMGRGGDMMGRGDNENERVSDDDGDGQPGLTLLTREPFEQDGSGRPYAKPPLGGLFLRAEKLMLAIAVQGQLEGAFESCDVVSGTLRAGAVATSALSCTARLGAGAEMACDPAAVQFLDENLPVWSVKSARFRAVRVASRACGDIRAALR